MNVTLERHELSEVRADVLVVGAGTGEPAGALAQLDPLFNGQLMAELRRQRFAGADGEAALFQTHGALPYRDIVAVGIGNGQGPRPWYTLAHTAVSRCRDLHATSVAVVIPPPHLSPDTIEWVIEGSLLSAYTFTRLKGAGSPPAGGPRHRQRLQRLAVVHPQADAAARAALRRAQLSAAATTYARDIINTPASIVTPTYLAGEARRIARAQGLQARILDATAMRRAGMGATLGVAQGSAQPPRFIELIHRPSRRPPTCVALVGKGITFDSGGLSLKPADAMQAQKRDMAGGGTVLAVMSVIRDLGPAAEVRAYIPCTENMPGGKAIKPGDVVCAHGGKTIEVLNTDAEGRLVLADALSYAAQAKPNVLIDLATLTAAVRAALGPRYAAIMGTDPALVRALIAATTECGEHLWELPLAEEYRTDLHSTVADLKNIGDPGTGAGTIIGGLFLREFVGTVPWAHIDFSSTVVADKAFPCHPRGATGFGVRTLLRYLRHS